MPRFIRSFLSATLISLFLLVSSPLSAAEINAHVDAAAQAQMASQGLVGLGIGLIVDNEIVHLGGATMPANSRGWGV